MMGAETEKALYFHTCIFENFRCELFRHAAMQSDVFIICQPYLSLNIPVVWCVVP